MNMLENIFLEFSDSYISFVKENIRISKSKTGSIMIDIFNNRVFIKK